MASNTQAFVSLGLVKLNELGVGSHWEEASRADFIVPDGLGCISTGEEEKRVLERKGRGQEYVSVLGASSPCVKPPGCGLGGEHGGRIEQ